MTRDQPQTDKNQRILLVVAGYAVASVVVGATLILPGMMSWSPGVLGVVATAGMALFIRQGLTSRRYVSAWVAVAATPLLAVCGFAATYVWSYAASAFPP